MMDTQVPRRPESLTPERALSLLPTYDLNPDWEAKRVAGTLPDGPLGSQAMILVTWPDEQLTMEEARYVLALDEIGSMRWLACQVTGDDNQIIGSNLIEAARRVVNASVQ